MWLKMTNPTTTGKALRTLLLGLALWGAPAAASVPASEQLMYAGDVVNALAAAKNEAEDSGDIAAQERLIDIYLTIGLPDRAVKRYRTRVATAPTDPNAHYLLGRALPTAAEARRSYERALKLEPTHARSHMGMGAVYTAEGDIGSALEAYARATRYDPSLEEAWVGLTRAHLSKDDTSAALATGRRAMEAAPAAPEPYLIVAVLDPASARAILERGATRAPDDPRVHASLAEVLLTAGDPQGSLAAAGKALAIDPTEPAALKARLFATELAEDRIDQAGYQALLAAQEQDRGYDALVSRYPRSALALAARSRARASTDPGAAIRDLEAALAQAPEEAEFNAAYGLLLLSEKRPAEAVEPLAKAAGARPWDPSLGVAYGTALTRANRHADAITWLKASSATRPYDSATSIALADAYLAARQPEAAYQTVLAAAERRMDERLVIALMAAATQTGRFTEAAEIMEQIAASSGDPRARELAERLREKAE